MQLILLFGSLISICFGVQLLLVSKNEFRKFIGIMLILIPVCILSTMYSSWVDNRIFNYYTIQYTLKDGSQKELIYVKSSKLNIEFSEDSTMIICDTIKNVKSISLIKIEEKRYGEVYK